MKQAYVLTNFYYSLDIYHKMSSMGINTPPKVESVKNWLIKRYGNDFEPKFLENIITDYFKTIDTHKEYSKNKVLKYIRTNIFKLDRIYRKQEKLYWISRGWSEDESEKKRIVRNKDWYIKIYGEIDGLNFFNKKNENISKNTGNTLNRFVKKYGEELGLIKWGSYKESCKRNLQFFIKKYGEELGPSMFQKFKEKSTINGYTLDFCVKKYGEELGKKKYEDYLVKIKPNKENFIKKYGEELGILSYYEFLEKITVRRGKASKKSLNIFLPLYDWLLSFVDKNEIYFGYKNNKEYFINNEGSFYLYDFTIRNKNIIIEYNGSKFHANPSLTETDLKKWKNPYSNEDYTTNIKRFNNKIKVAENNGFKVLVLWDNCSDENNIEKCKNFILNNE
jgi:hypothetical protein